MAHANLKQIEMLILDVDGVLTAGEIIYSDTGDQIKVFNVKDGIGIRLLKEAGIKVGIITGRQCDALRHRCRNLGIELVYDGIMDKTKALEEITRKTGVATKAMAYMGDDLPDLPVMKSVGLAVAVADAHELVQGCAHMVTKAPGGRGAVREISEAILKAQNLWDDLIHRLFDG